MIDRNIFLVGVVLTILITGCQIKEQSDNHQANKIFDENFDAFYSKFHNDSVFQLSRIVFPLPGINTDAMNVEDTSYFWSKSSWLMQHLVDTTMFERSTIIADDVVEEQITSPDPGLIIKKKYQRIKGKWYLVYYEDVNL